MFPSLEAVKWRHFPLASVGSNRRAFDHLTLQGGSAKVSRFEAPDSEILESKTARPSSFPASVSWRFGKNTLDASKSRDKRVSPPVFGLKESTRPRIDILCC